MGDIGVFKVSTVTPKGGSIDVPTNSEINITFNLDVDAKTITNGVTVISDNGVVVNGSLSYDRDRTVTFVPSLPLEQSTKYDVIVKSSIKSILERSCETYVFSFTTKKVNEILPPKLVSPVNISMIHLIPDLSWLSVTGVNGYEVQISLWETFTDIIWSAPLSCPIETSSNRLVIIRPQMKFDLNRVYYWRARSIVNGEASVWSEIFRFSIDLENDPVIVTEDLSTEVESEYVHIVKDLFPEFEFSNVATNLKVIYITLEGLVDPTKLNPINWFIAGNHLLEDDTLNTFDYNNSTYDPSNSSAVLSRLNHGQIKGSWSVILDEARNKSIIVFQPIPVL